MTWLDPMDCPRFEDLASEFLDGRLDETTAAAMRLHARQCAACGPLLEALHGTMEALAALPAPALPSGFETEVLAHTSGERRNAAGWGPTLQGLGRILWQPRLAMGIAVAWFGFTLLLNVTGIRLRRLHPGDLAPAHWPQIVSRTLHRTYARGVRFYYDLRVVYEIQAALHAIHRQTQAAPAHTPGQSARPPYNWNPSSRTLAHQRHPGPGAGLHLRWAWMSRPKTCSLGRWV